jgi:hypothetical protein
VPSTRIRTFVRITSVIAAAPLLLALGLAGTNSASAATSSATVSASSSGTVQAASARRSGLGWNSGVYMPSGSPAVYDSFGAWRGHRIDVAVLWTARQTWSDMVNPNWLYQTWAGTPVTKVIGLPPIPEGDNATMAGCAKGAYDGKWSTFAKNIKAAGMDDETIIRLGWEFNGNWYKWSAKSPRQFASCWRHVVSAAERVAPKLRWDWTVNRGAGQSVTDARKAWPGNKYVDIVGVDAYDMWPGANSAAAWNNQLNGKYGLKFWRNFAKAHHKKLSVPEWGVYPGTAQIGHNGGDNSYYVKKMNSFFKANASMIAYEAYFNESASYYGGSIFGPVQNPKASAAYRTAF